MKKINVAFVCVHNSCRSQMAEAWANELGSDMFNVYSAGTEDYHEIKPLAVEVMKEVGISMDKQYPKTLDKIPPADFLITMGCGAECPWVPSRLREDWGLDDPSGGPIEDFRVTRDLIKDKVLELIQRVKNKEI